MRFASRSRRRVMLEWRFSCVVPTSPDTGSKVCVEVLVLVSALVAVKLAVRLVPAARTDCHQKRLQGGTVGVTVLVGVTVAVGVTVGVPTAVGVTVAVGFGAGAPLDGGPGFCV